LNGIKLKIGCRQVEISASRLVPHQGRYRLTEYESVAQDIVNCALNGLKIFAKNTHVVVITGKENFS